MLDRPERRYERTRLLDHAAGTSSAERGVSGLVPSIHRSLSVSSAEKWGRLPELSLISAVGLLIVALAFSGARAGALWAEALFWGGLLVLVAPVALRLATVEPSRRERMALIVVLGLSLYLVKVMHSPFAFTFPDELTHLHNVDEVLEHHRLFQENPILPVTPLYPGLEAVTGALVTVTGMSAFAAGLTVIGAARLVLMLALYLFYEWVSDSSRVASIAALLYTANSNFVFWSAQFAYESLALPLAALVLFVVVRRAHARVWDRHVALTAAAILTVMAVVITHHLSSYALVAFLVVVSLLYRLFSNTYRSSPWDVALVALGATAIWLVSVARLTIGYLSPVLTGAVRSIIQLIAKEETGRQLFQSSSGEVAPLWEQVVGSGSVILILVGLAFGILAVWRHHRRNVFALVLTGTALIYFPLQGLRLTGAGWETANRASEFLFVGISFVVSLAFVKLWVAQEAHWIQRVLFAGYVSVVFTGGIIAGWQPNARLAQPYLIDADDHLIRPQGVTAAQWTREHLRPHTRIAADESNAKLLLAYGEQYPYTGSKYGIRQMMFSEEVGRTEQHIMQVTDVRYVLVDRRRISWDHMVGIYHNHTWDDTTLLDREVVRKFDQQQNVSRIYDSGNIVMYHVGRIVDGPPLE